MRVNRIPIWEDRVKTTGNNGLYQVKQFSVPILGDCRNLDGYLISPSSGYQGYFYAEKIKKEKIVLHFTAGYLTGDLSVLMNKQRGHVSVPFVLARDGSIYRPFSSSYWSYHLGRGSMGGNAAESKKSIGIELSNIGYLTLDPVNNTLNTIYGRAYCSVNDTHLYTKLDTPFRGQHYYATFTDEQYDSVISLLRYLTAQYDIPRQFLSEDVRYKYTDKVLGFKGILSHVNYRSSGKWDFGPAFDWERVMSGVMAAEFMPKAYFGHEIKERSVVEDMETLDNQHVPNESNVFDANTYGEDGPEENEELLRSIYEREAVTVPVK